MSWFVDKCGYVRFKVYSKNPGAGWFWASRFDQERPRQPLNEHGPYPFKRWASRAARRQTRR